MGPAGGSHSRQSQSFYNYCPRDILLVIADHIIETPNVIRSRSQGSFSDRKLHRRHAFATSKIDRLTDYLETIQVNSQEQLGLEGSPSGIEEDIREIGG